jgi:hypothetical protein|tara:strand:+ start:1358 stop:1909 length:552 start_codon:yes stop_codon:yes gene_type:complete
VSRASTISGCSAGVKTVLKILETRNPLKVVEVLTLRLPFACPWTRLRRRSQCRRANRLLAKDAPKANARPLEATERDDLVTVVKNGTRLVALIDLQFHDLRHEAGSRFLEGRMPLHHVREMLGHASLSTTNTYLNVTGHDLRESMRRLDKERTCCKVVASSGKHDQRVPCNEEVAEPGNRLTH